MSKNKKRGIPSSPGKSVSKQFQMPTPVESKPFNAGKLIFNFLVLTRLQHDFAKEGEAMELYFDGIMRGYEDWFEALSITQDDFDRVQSKMDKKEILDEVTRVKPKFKEQWEKRMKQNEPLIMLPGADPKRARMAMDLFARKLEESRR